MVLEGTLLTSLYGFGLILFRTAGLIVSGPVWSARFVPVRIRLAAALVISFAIFSGAGMPRVPLPTSVLMLAGAAVAETAIGLCGGFAARVVLDAATAAGHVAGLGMGMGYGALLDPFNGASSTVISQIYSIVAIGMGVAVGLHREALLWLTRSVAGWPPGTAEGLPSLLNAVVGHSLVCAALAVRLAFPVLAAVTFGHLGLGLIGRTAAQLNLASVGFSVAILAGGAALYSSAPGAAEIAAREAIAFFARSL